MTHADFIQATDGSLAPAPYFPLPQEIQNGRIVHFYDPSYANGPTEYGIIKIHQVNFMLKIGIQYKLSLTITFLKGSFAKKDVLFHRSSVYVWNVSLENANLSLILKVK